MAQLVTVDQLVPALTSDIGSSSTVETAALATALSGIGIGGGGGSTISPPTGGLIQVPSSLVFVQGAPSTVLATSPALPRAGVISIAATCAISPQGGAVLNGTILVGGWYGYVEVAGKRYASAGAEPYAPNSGQSGFIPIVSMACAWIPVNAGDTIVFKGLLIWQGSATNNWVPSIPAGSPDSNNLTWHYVV